MEVGPSGRPGRGRRVAAALVACALGCGSGRLAAAADSGGGAPASGLDAAREALGRGAHGAAAALASRLPRSGPLAPQVLRLQMWAALGEGDHAAVEAGLAAFDGLAPELAFVRAAARFRAAPSAAHALELRHLWWAAPDGVWGQAALRELAAAAHGARAEAPFGAAEARLVRRVLPRGAFVARPPAARPAACLARLLREAPRRGRLADELAFAAGVHALHRQAFAAAVGRLRPLLLRLPGAAPLAAPVALALAEAERRAGLYGAALAHYDLAAAAPRLASTARAAAGAMAVEFRRYDEARERLTALLHANPFDAQRQNALFWLGWIAFRQADWGAADRFFATAHGERPYGPRAPAALYWRARARLEAGRPAAAQPLLAALTERFPLDYYAWRAAGLQAGPARPEPLPAEPAAPVAALARQVEQLTAAGLTRAARRALVAVPAAHLEASGPEDLGRLAHSAQAVGLGPFAAHLTRQRCRRFFDQPECRRLLAALYETPHAELLARAARDNRVEPALALALTRAESAFDPGAVSAAGALGLMQLMPATGLALWREGPGPGRRRRPPDLLDPAVNVTLGMRFLGRLLRAFDNGAELTLATYNAGPQAVMRWRHKLGQVPADVFVEEIPFEETRTYVKRILAGRHLLRQLAPSAVAPRLRTALRPLSR